MLRGLIVAVLLLLASPASAGLCDDTGATAISTRQKAATINLTGCDRVMTLAHSSASRGGAAIFKPAGSTPFIDSFAYQATFTPGSGYQDGIYHGVALIGSSTGRGLFALVTISGGHVVSVDFSGTPGNSYTVGDVLSPPMGDYLCSRLEHVVRGGPGPTCNPAAGSGFTITVTQVTDPLASFTDAASNRWQYVPDPYVNTEQFGGIANGWSATPFDNFNSIQAALRFATAVSPQLSFESGGSWGGKVYLPLGSSMFCGTGNKSLIVPQGVRFSGPGTSGGALRLCSTFNPAVHAIELGNPDDWFATFDNTLEYMGIIADRNAPANPWVALVHTNSAQDGGGVHHVHFLPGKRMCAWFRKGFGGASSVEFHDNRCSGNSDSMAIAFGDNQNSFMNYGTTMINAYNVVFGGPSSAPFGTGGGYMIKGGVIKLTATHCELLSRCAEILIAADATGSVEISNMNAGSGSSTPGTPMNCYAVIQLDQGNVPGNVSVSQVEPSSCGATVLNIQSGSSVPTYTEIQPGANQRFF